jgi:hypothetical protein
MSPFLRLKGNRTYLSVLSVSCLNLTPGARLQISRPTDEPPNASCKIRVNFELRYGIRDYGAIVSKRSGLINEDVQLLD